MTRVNSLGLECFKDPREDWIMPRWSVLNRRTVRARGRLIVVACIVHGLLGHIAVRRAVIRHQGVVGVVANALPRDANLEKTSFETTTYNIMLTTYLTDP